MSVVEIHTDGACAGNPGAGGWAAVLRYGDKERRVVGSAEATTNQQMELTAAVRGLEALKRPCRVVLCSDSAYLVNAFEKGWLEKWRKNGWRNAKGDPVKNQELWQRLLELTEIHEVEWRKVAGHAGEEANELADALAVDACAEVIRRRLRGESVATEV